MKYFVYLNGKYLPLTKSKISIIVNNKSYEQYELKHTNCVLLEKNNEIIVNDKYKNRIYYTTNYFQSLINKYTYLAPEKIFKIKLYFDNLDTIQ
jgi:hypothetical protein